MAAVSESIVREYFELHDFFVRQHRKDVGRSRTDEEDEIDFFVMNLHPKAREAALPFVLSSAELAFVGQAVVVVKGWHTMSFSAGTLAHTPDIVRFFEPKVIQQAARAFDQRGAPLKILVLPSLPQAAEAREQSIALLRSKGLDAVLPFHTVLADLIRQTEVNRNYQKSDVLQMIRILKTYGFFKEPQLELFKPKRRRSAE